jgi:hypothetical protein
MPWRVERRGDVLAAMSVVCACVAGSIESAGPTSRAIALAARPAGH